MHDALSVHKCHGACYICQHGQPREHAQAITAAADPTLRGASGVQGVAEGLPHAWHNDGVHGGAVSRVRVLHVAVDLRNANVPREGGGDSGGGD